MVSSMRWNRTVGWAAVALVVGCRSAPPDAARNAVHNGQSADVEMLALISVSSVPDERHTVPIDGPTGQRLYRDPTPGISMPELNLAAGVDVEEIAGTYALLIRLKKASERAIATWSEERVGHTVGYVLQGRLICVKELENQILSAIAVPCFASLREACGAATALEQTGGGRTHGCDGH